MPDHGLDKRGQTGGLQIAALIFRFAFSERGHKPQGQGCGSYNKGVSPRRLRSQDAGPGEEHAA
jgi:hypothetical protein